MPKAPKGQKATKPPPRNSRKRADGEETGANRGKSYSQLRKEQIEHDNKPSEKFSAKQFVRELKKHKDDE